MQQILQNTLDGAEADFVRNKLFDQFLLFLVHFFQQFLSFGIRQQFGHIVLDQFGNMRGNNRCRVDHGIAAEHGFFAIALVYPHRFKPESRLIGLFAGQRNRFAARIHDQQLGGAQLAFAGFDLFDINIIFIGLKLHIVLNTDRGHDESEFGSQGAAQGLDLVGQLFVGFFINQRQQPVADFQTYQIHAQSCGNRLIGSFGNLALLLFLFQNLLCPGHGRFLLLVKIIGGCAGQSRQQDKRRRRRTGK